MMTESEKDEFAINQGEKRHLLILGKISNNINDLSEQSWETLTVRSIDKSHSSYNKPHIIFIANWIILTKRVEIEYIYG